MKDEQPDSSSKKILVRFKFRGEKDEYRVKLTCRQYDNLKEVKSLEFCEVVEDEND
ncbi:MAG: hypothetical protein KGH89_01495 [Thaumarchaeota archaeon]|nr:hypothetical protein [Nitrososphaerota archaeon]MDE1867033.1 hypothetical protein [Nitrososphaerota archaeon]